MTELLEGYFPQDLARLISLTVKIPPKVFYIVLGRNKRRKIENTEYGRYDSYGIMFVLKADGTLWWRIEDEPFELITSYIRDIKVRSSFTSLKILIVTLNGNLITIVLSPLKDNYFLSSLGPDNINRTYIFPGSAIRVTDVEGKIYEQKLLYEKDTAYTLMTEPRVPYEIIDTTTTIRHSFYLLSSGKVKHSTKTYGKKYTKIDSNRSASGRLSVGGILYIEMMNTKETLTIPNVKDFVHSLTGMIIVITKQGEVKTYSLSKGVWHDIQIKDVIFASYELTPAFITKSGKIYIKQHTDITEVPGINVFT